MPSERRFSASSALIGKRRTRLNILSVRASMCLHDWIKLDFARENKAWLENQTDAAAEEDVSIDWEENLDAPDADYGETESEDEDEYGTTEEICPEDSVSNLA